MCILEIRTPPAGVMHGLVRNQIPLEGLRYADVLAARVCEWMPAMHYGAQGGPSYSARCIGIAALNLVPLYVSECGTFNHTYWSSSVCAEVLIITWLRHRDLLPVLPDSAALHTGK